MDGPRSRSRTLRLSMSSLGKVSMRKLRKRLREHIARPLLQRPYRLLYRVALAGMNYGGAGSSASSGDLVALQRIAANRDRQSVVLDVGANVGTYLGQVLATLGTNTRVFALEPSRTAFEALERRFGGTPGVQLSRVGVGAVPGRATLWGSQAGSVLASIYPSGNESGGGEDIEVVTIDEFCAARQIEQIDLLKLDVEGAELDALRGARGLLERGAIGMVQFEFGQPSLGARTFFADLFHLLAPQYEIYRVLPRGLERIEAYHETLEVFMSTNYLAIVRGS
ncbi:MAG: FkbM family methyltransferase [Kofleriaceae bacterium]|nr:FkbM family methyltransferase [Kofleriaceae bacterium]